MQPLKCQNLVTFSGGLEYGTPIANANLLSTAKLVWCDNVDNMNVSQLQPITKTNCETGYVQVADGRIGVAAKERLFIYSIMISNYNMPLNVEFNTTTARRYIHCDGVWNNSTNEFTVQRTAIYNVTTMLQFNNSDSQQLTASIAITNNGQAWSTSMLQVAANSSRPITLNAIITASQGDLIAVEIPQFMGVPSFSITARTISIIEL